MAQQWSEVDIAHKRALEWVTLARLKPTMPLPPAVADRLRACSLSDVIDIAHHEPVKTVSDVIRVLAIPSHDVVKSLVLTGSDGHVLVCIAGSATLDMRRVALVLGPSARLASRSELQGLGVPVGAISPISCPALRCLCDRRLLEPARFVYLGSGDTSISLRLMSSSLRLLPHVEVCDVESSLESIA